MNTLYQWIDDRTGLATASRHCAAWAIPRGWRVPEFLASMAWFTFVVEAITGVVLWMYYSPSAQTAWESVYYIQNHLSGGWLLRAVHHYAAQLLVVILVVYVLHMIFSGRYRAPGEFVFWSALVLAGLSLGFCLTGDLLPWDQNSYSATLVRTKFLLLLPGIGSSLFKLAAGGPGPGFGHFTVTRFFALHAGVLGAIFLAVMAAWIWFRRQARLKACVRGDHAVPYWPSQAAWHMAGSLAVIALVAALVMQHGGYLTIENPHAGAGVPLMAPADPDPSAFYAAARPEWSFRGLYEFSNMFPGSLKILPIFVIPGLVAAFFFAMPITGKVALGHRLNQAVTALLLIGLAVLSYRSYQHDAHSAEYQLALAEGRGMGQRVAVLAKGPAGIPPEGALALLRDDAKTQGAVLFKQHCASCHSHTGGHGPDIAAEKSSAPDLGDFASKRWLNGFLDPKQIAGPKYFGDTKFKDGDMVDYVKSTLRELRDEAEVGEEALQKLIACLESESQLISARKVEGENIEGIDEETRLLFEDFTCSDCHQFYGSGAAGGPDLTAYGSREWLIGIISDPTHSRFYGEENDRMPAYRKSEKDYVLTQRQVEMVADWLHGRWFEPENEQ